MITYNHTQTIKLLPNYNYEKNQMDKFLINHGNYYYLTYCYVNGGIDILILDIEGADYLNNLRNQTINLQDVRSNYDLSIKVKETGIIYDIVDGKPLYNNNDNSKQQEIKELWKDIKLLEDVTVKDIQNSFTSEMRLKKLERILIEK